MEISLRDWNCSRFKLHYDCKRNSSCSSVTGKRCSILRCSINFLDDFIYVFFSDNFGIKAELSSCVSKKQLLILIKISTYFYIVMVIVKVTKMFNSFRECFTIQDFWRCEWIWNFLKSGLMLALLQCGGLTPKHPHYYYRADEKLWKCWQLHTDTYNSPTIRDESGYSGLLV